MKKRSKKTDEQSLGLEVETSTPEELLALIELHNKTWQARLSSTGLAAAN